MKFILTLAAMLLINFCAIAQTDVVRTELNFIFQNIDKTQIPTGYLNEYGPDVVNKKWLNGVLSDSNFVRDLSIYNFLYNDIEDSRINVPSNTTPLYNARINQPIVLPLDSANVWIDIALYDSLTNLAIFSANYSSLREDALQQNLFTKVGNQIFDVAGRTQSPYILNHTFAAVPVLSESKYTNQIRLGYTPLYYGNNASTIATVQVNFLNGLGYQTLFANGVITPITNTYSDSSGFKKFAVKVIYNNGNIDECYTGQMVNVVLANPGNTSNRYEPLTISELAAPNYSILPSIYLNVNPKISPVTMALFGNTPVIQNLIQKQKFNQNMKLYIRYCATRLGTPLANKL